jgi:hypothetical protein
MCDWNSGLLAAPSAPRGLREQPPHERLELVRRATVSVEREAHSPPARPERAGHAQPSRAGSEPDACARRAPPRSASRANQESGTRRLPAADEVWRGDPGPPQPVHFGAGVVLGHPSAVFVCLDYSQAVVPEEPLAVCGPFETRDDVALEVGVSAIEEDVASRPVASRLAHLMRVPCELV